MDRELLDEQIAYYRARAPEYDEWFLRLGRHDRGEAQRRAWFEEVVAVEAALAAARPRGRVLELACGTGLWTRRLAELASELTAVDASPEVLRINRERVASERVHYVQADLFGWQPSERFDFAFFGFWLSHIPPERFDAFWSMLRGALAPGGSAFFVDNLDARREDSRDFVAERELNDGRRFRIVKVFYEPRALELRLAALGWRGDVRSTGEYFLHGCVRAA